MALVLEDSNRRPATVLPSRIIAFSFRSVVRSANTERNSANCEPNGSRCADRRGVRDIRLRTLSSPTVLAYMNYWYREIGDVPPQVSLRT